METLIIIFLLLPIQLFLSLLCQKKQTTKDDNESEKKN